MNAATLSVNTCGSVLFGKILHIPEQHETQFRIFPAKQWSIMRIYSTVSRDEGAHRHPANIYIVISTADNSSPRHADPRTFLLSQVRVVIRLHLILLVGVHLCKILKTGDRFITSFFFNPSTAVYPFWSMYITAKISSVDLAMDGCTDEGLTMKSEYLEFDSAIL